VPPATDTAGPPGLAATRTDTAAMAGRAQPVRQDGRMPPSANSVVVREAYASDESRLVWLDRVAWSPRSGFPSVIKRAGDAFFLADSPPQAHLVAEIGAEVVGYLRLGPASRLPENAHVLVVQGLAVVQQARRRGVATALLTAAEQRARSRGARKLSLRALGSNDDAIRLYTRLGYQPEGVLRDEFLIEGRYVDDVLLAKHLGAGTPLIG
jgi:ribosomal protein S18 acetylase RimI-like enzyme